MLKTLAIVGGAAAGAAVGADYVRAPLAKLVKADTPTAEKAVAIGTFVGLTVMGTAIGLALLK